MDITLLGFTWYVHTARNLRHACRALGLRAPANLHTMYLAGEHPAYLQAAIMAVNQTGA